MFSINSNPRLSFVWRRGSPASGLLLVLEWAQFERRVIGLCEDREWIDNWLLCSLQLRCIDVFNTVWFRGRRTEFRADGGRRSVFGLFLLLKMACRINIVNLDYDHNNATCIVTCEYNASILRTLYVLIICDAVKQQEVRLEYRRYLKPLVSKPKRAWTYTRTKRLALPDDPSVKNREHGRVLGGDEDCVM